MNRNDKNNPGSSRGSGVGAGILQPWVTRVFVRDLRRAQKSNTHGDIDTIYVSHKWLSSDFNEKQFHKLLQVLCCSKEELLPNWDCIVFYLPYKWEEYLDRVPILKQFLPVLVTTVSTLQLHGDPTIVHDYLKTISTTLKLRSSSAMKMSFQLKEIQVVVNGSNLREPAIQQDIRGIADTVTSMSSNNHNNNKTRSVELTWEMHCGYWTHRTCWDRFCQELSPVVTYKVTTLNLRFDMLRAHQLLQLLQQPVLCDNDDHGLLKRLTIVAQTAVIRRSSEDDYSTCNDAVVTMIQNNPNLTSIRLIDNAWPCLKGRSVEYDDNYYYDDYDYDHDDDHRYLNGIRYDLLPMHTGMNRVHQILNNEKEEEEDSDGGGRIATCKEEKIILALASVRHNLSCIYKVLQLHNEICCNPPSSTSTTTATTANGGGDDGSSNAVKESVLAATTGNSRKRKQRNWG